VTFELGSQKSSRRALLRCSLLSSQPRAEHFEIFRNRAVEVESLTSSGVAERQLLSVECLTREANRSCFF